jgi:hypothetical protein
MYLKNDSGGNTTLAVKRIGMKGISKTPFLKVHSLRAVSISFRSSKTQLLPRDFTLELNLLK